jgi:hypothetical protein
VHLTQTLYSLWLEGYLLDSQELATCPYTETGDSNIHAIPSVLSRCLLTLPSHLRLGLPSDLNIRFSSHYLIISYFSDTCHMRALILTKILLKKKSLTIVYISLSSYLLHLPPWFKISTYLTLCTRKLSLYVQVKLSPNKS